MKPASLHRNKGFTLIELTIAMALGVLILGTAVALFSKALDASFIVTQRAEMQQNGRAAVGMLAKDISLAGAGLPTGGVQLPSGAGATTSLYGCDQTTCYLTTNTYPSNHLYGAIPGPAYGMSINAGGAATDVATVAYTDTTFPLNVYSVTIAAGGVSATFTLPTPPPVPLPPAINDPAVGLKAGDLVLFSNNLGSGVGEVTNVAAGGVVSFANSDPLNINQSAAAAGNLSAIAAATQTIAYRLLVITYYIDVPPGPDGIRYTADDGPPRLMRQVNGQSPIPVAENISGLQFTYDIFDDTTGTATANLKDAGMSAGKTPNQIRKVNLSVTTRSPLHGGQGFQSLGLATSVSARDMSFKDRYQ
jgi:prepilin-type N-terminal cleavage/methylation domain-containing protein